MTDTVRAAEIVAGDIVSLPRTGVTRCRVQVVRSVVPGSVWLYLVDLSTGARMRGHVELPLDKEVVRHAADGVPTIEDQDPDDA